MKPKYTPGPWSFDEIYGLIMADKNKIEVAACHSGRGGDVNANARLIASAPDLLRAVKWAMALATADDHEKAKPHYEAERIATLTCIIEIIRKAEGRENETK